MKILIVGCGAVGRVYGFFLQKAGVTLGLMDKPEFVPKLELALSQDGLALSQIKTGNRPGSPCVLSDFQVIHDIEACRRFAADQIWFTIPSQAYDTSWFRDFIKQADPPLAVCFVPEGKRSKHSIDSMQERTVFAGTTFMAWQGGLDGGGGRKEGINFWRSPLGTPLMGARQACREVAGVLRAAGFHPQIDTPESKTQITATALLTTFVAGLELCHWSLREFKGSHWCDCAAAAFREATAGQAAGHKDTFRLWMRQPVLSACFSCAAALLPLLFPFDIEKYLQVHYTKTREQTQFLLRLLAQDAERNGLSHTNLTILLTHIQSRSAESG